MPRVPRIKSNTGIYHIIARGINQQNIFSHDEDYARFLGTVTRCPKKYSLFSKD
jgi:hypothetical protein